MQRMILMVLLLVALYGCGNSPQPDPSMTPAPPTTTLSVPTPVPSPTYTPGIWPSAIYRAVACKELTGFLRAVPEGSDVYVAMSNKDAPRRASDGPFDVVLWVAVQPEELELPLEAAPAYAYAGVSNLAVTTGECAANDLRILASSGFLTIASARAVTPNDLATAIPCREWMFESFDRMLESTPTAHVESTRVLFVPNPLLATKTIDGVELVRITWLVYLPDDEGGYQPHFTDLKGLAATKCQ